MQNCLDFADPFFLAAIFAFRQNGEGGTSRSLGIPDQGRRLIEFTCVSCTDAFVLLWGNERVFKQE